MKEPVYLTDSKSADESDYNKIGLTLFEMQENYKNMAASVAKYNGFYVGRYETSLSNAPANTHSNCGSRMTLYIK